MRRANRPCLLGWASTSGSGRRWMRFWRPWRESRRLVLDHGPVLPVVDSVGAISMSIFNLHANVLDDYRDFVRSFFTVADHRAREFIERELVEEARLWPEALLQVSPSYARVASVDELAARGRAATRDGPDFPQRPRRAVLPLSAPGRGAGTCWKAGKLRRHQRHGFGQEPHVFPAHH